MQIIYIGSLYPPGLIDMLREKKSSIDFAAENFQSSLLSGLCSLCPQLKVLTAPNITSYPHVDVPFYQRNEFILPGSSVTHISPGFINILGLKHISKLISLRRELRRQIRDNDVDAIIVYGVHSPFLMALCGLKKRHHKVCLIVPDLPEYMSESRNRIYLLAKKIDRFFISWGIKQVDRFVLFSPYMRERLPIGNKPWIHIEGIFNPEGMEAEYPKKTKAQKVILYMGNISHRYGIINLLDAFALIKSPDYRLWIRGDGNTLEEIRRRMANDPRIVYFDKMSKQELVALQRRATILINPVFSGEEFTRYFFPSKTMEYLASGTPTVMAHLACMPKEYDPYIYYFDEESVEGIRDKIVEVCEKSQEELDVFGAKAAKFILQEKNKVTQSRKLVEFMQ